MYTMPWLSKLSKPRANDMRTLKSALIWGGAEGAHEDAEEDADEELEKHLVHLFLLDVVRRRLFELLFLLQDGVVGHVLRVLRVE